MPKGSAERTERRKSEILDACEKIYREQGFYGVNIKEISTETSFTRPAIYNYFETKEEILLGLLAREYENWCGELEKIEIIAEKLNRVQLAEQIAHTLEQKTTLLRILNMNLYEIEQNSRVERLAEFKKLYFRSVTALTEILRGFKISISDKDCEEFCELFLAFLFGVYPFAFHSEKQVKAMKLAGVRLKEPTIYQMVNQCLLRFLPDEIKKNKEEEQSMSKVLVAYFSASSTTAKLAGNLASAIHADLHEIQPKTPYTRADLDWMDKKSRSSVEMKDKSFRPAIANQVENMEVYDTVFLAFPIWWYVAPTIVNTFLEQYDWKGKTIIPLATSGGSGMGNTNQELAPSCPGADLKEGRVFSANTDKNTLIAWAESFGC